MINPILTPPDELQREKKKQAALTSALGTKEPGSPVSAPESGIAAKPKTIDIGGIPHLDLPDQKYPGPISMAAGAAVGTIGHIATAPFGNRAEERLAANRAELNNETAEPQAKTKPVPSTSGITGGVQAVANQGVADLAGRQAGHMIDNNLRSFEDKGNSTVRQVGADGKIEFTNVGTENVTDPSKKVTVNSYNGAADNESLAKANAIRQSIIDRQPVGGVGILGDGGVEAANQEKTARWRQDDLLQQANRGNQGAVAAIIHGNAQASTELIRGQNQLASEQGRNAVAVRGQDILAKNEEARLAGNPVDNQLKQAQAQGIGATTDSVREQAELRGKLLTETDPAKRTAMQEAMLLAQGRDPNQGRYIRMGGGEQVVDPLTGQKAKAPDQVFDSRTGQTVQTGKRALSDADFAAIGKKIGLSADALKARYGEFQKQGPATSLKDFNTVDVALALADGTPPEKIAGTIKRLGGNPAEYGL